MIIAMDFDGTLCEFKFPEIGEIKDNVFRQALYAKYRGHKLILWTCRHGDLLVKAIQWCNERGLYFTAVNDDVKDMKDFWGDNRSNKVTANLYVDDKSPGSIDYFLNMEL